MSVNNPILEEETGVWNVVRRIVLDLLRMFVREIIRFAVVFALGTGVAALVCLYYGIAIKFALLGGFLVLGVALGFVFLLN
jgi:hypothetical protein